MALQNTDPTSACGTVTVWHYRNLLLLFIPSVGIFSRVLRRKIGRKTNIYCIIIIVIIPDTQPTV